MNKELHSLKASTEKYLSKFGNDRTDVLSYENRESFLVRVLNASSQSNTFNDLRYETYVSKKTPLHQLPPTSYSLRGHLERSDYVTNMCLNILSEARFSLHPKCFGWKKVDGVLIPDKRELYMSPEYIVVRGCSKHCTGRYKCIKNESCTEFCKCRDIKLTVEIDRTV